MNNKPSGTMFGRWWGLAAALVLLASGPVQGRVVDDFNDNTKTDWTDFTFIPGYGLPTESNGQFRFEQTPSPLSRPIFSASQKTSELFTLQEGRTVEFRVDLVQGGGQDSFAVLGFIPKEGSPGTLGGYSVAKSSTDILITKSASQYFYNEEPPSPIKHENITLSLSMTVSGGNVIIQAQVLDRENKDAVLFSHTVVDTPAADPLADGTDNPPAPYITSGYFTLYLYQDFDAGSPEDPYLVVYDNAAAYVTDAKLLDDFNSAKTDWADFTFIPDFGIPTVVGGQFRFEQPPSPLSRPIFSASQKTSSLLEIKEGERLQLRVDVMEGGDQDSFAVLAFIPKEGSPGTLAGYALAKSTTDILITKSATQYFYDENPAPPIKQQNITLVLTLTGAGGNVIINAKVLDKENAKAVLFDQTVVDTPAADVMDGGTDNPPAPYFTSGYATLYLYQDYDAGAPENPYKAYFDNLGAAAPPAAANTPPLIGDVQPVLYANFLPASTEISFKVTDDKPLADEGISVTLNGTKHTTSNGLVLTGTGAMRTAKLGGLAENKNYVALLAATDSEGLSVTNVLYFDTFKTDNLMVEVEDYNFEAGQYVNDPVLYPEGFGPAPDTFANQTGIADVDFSDTRATPNSEGTMYRTLDPVRMQHTVDFTRAKYTAAGGIEAGVYDYDVGDIVAGEWLNFTRDFPPGSYEVYLRQAVANMTQGESVLELVTGDRTQPSQTTRVLGSFLGTRTGFQYRNFPLTDGTGQNVVIARLTGVTTLRLRQVTTDPNGGARYQNYFIFIPVPDPGLQRATVSALSPAPGATVETLEPTIRVEIQNRDTTVATNSIVLQVNGATVPATITGDSQGAVVTYAMQPLPTSGAANNARVTFRDNFGVEQSSDWSFVITYRTVLAANRRAGPGQDPGFAVRVVQAPQGSNLENTLQRAEAQLAPNSALPKYYETNVTATVINFSQAEAGASGYFAEDALIPGLVPEENGTDDLAMEILVWIQLPAGTQRWGIRCDDGYEIFAGQSPTDRNAPLLAFHNGGPADETVDFIVPETGFYPFRMIWYERGGDAHVEWFAVDRNSGTRTLINDPASGNALKAYTSVAEPQVQLEAAAVASGPYQLETGAVVNEGARTITVPFTAGPRFFRLRYSGTVTPGLKVEFTGIRIENQQVILSYKITS